MICHPNVAGPQLAEILAENLKDVVDELRTIDPADLIGFLRFGHNAAVEDLIASATALFFRPGSLSYAWSGDIDVAWGAPPNVTLGMEFRHPQVSVFFDLRLGSVEPILVHGLVFEDQVDHEEHLILVAQAFGEARLPTRSTIAAWQSTSPRLGGRPILR